LTAGAARFFSLFFTFALANVLHLWFTSFVNQTTTHHTTPHTTMNTTTTKAFASDTITTAAEDQRVYDALATVAGVDLSQAGTTAGPHMGFGTLFVPAISDAVAEAIAVALEVAFGHPAFITRSEPTAREPHTEHGFDF
jgi:hypothetical protein